MSELSSLPAELIDMVSSSLSNADLLNLRSQSHTLRNGSTFEFRRRFLQSPLQVTGSRVHIQTLTTLLCDPDFSSAKASWQSLEVHLPVAKDMLPKNKSILPTAQDINNLLAALPHLEALTVGTEETDDGNAPKKTKALIKTRQKLASTFLKGLVRKGCPTSRLATLYINGSILDGALLLKALKAHEHSLKEISLRHIDLSVGKDAVKWRKIFRTLLKLDLDELCLEHLSDPGSDEDVVICDDSDDDDDILLSYVNWANVKHRANGDVGVTGCAQFARWYGFFTESYVRLGLRRWLYREYFRLHYYP